MTVLVLDTETIEHPDVPAKPRDDDRVPAAPHLRTVAACGIVLQEQLDDRGRVEWYEAKQAVVFGEGSTEARVIVEHIARAFARQLTPKVVDFNGGGFDMRVLVAEAMEHGIQIPLLFDKDFSYRYSRAMHEDVCDVLSNYGAGCRASQDAWARRIGLPGKIGVDGSQVKALWDAGRHEEIRAYCTCDAWQLAGVFLRKEFVAGALTAEGYRRSAASLVGLAESTPSLRPLVESERFRRGQFLMEAG